MTITVEALYEEALCLSHESRLALAERLLGSVPPDPAITEAQVDMARQRLKDIEDGNAQPVPGPERLIRVREAILKRSQE